jgi:hypothetical protein
VPKRKGRPVAKSPITDTEEPRLSAAWIREIERRVKDSSDPTRYVIVSVLLPGPRRRWELFYDISDDMWAMDIQDATLFKRRRTARVVADLLGDRYEVIEVRVGKNRKVIRPRSTARKHKR